MNTLADGYAARDLTGVIDDAPWSTYQKWILVCLAALFAMDGLANQSLGITLPALIVDWGETREAFAPVAAANLAGVAFGSVLGGLLGDRIGRRWALIGAVIMFGGMTAAGALTTDSTQLLIVRFLDGLGIGAAIPNGAALISEFTPQNRRGRAIAIGMVFIPIGGILAGGLGATLLELLGWKAVFLSAGAASLVLALIFIAVLPESPSFLLRNGRKAEVERLLARCGIATAEGETYHTHAVQSATAPLKILLTPALRRSTLLLWGGFFTCLMASYTIFSWVPTMLHSLDFDLTMTSIGITTFHTGGVIGALFSGVLLDRKGFSTAHMALSGVAAVLAAVLAVLLSREVVLAIVIFPVMMMLGFCLSGLHNTLYTLAANTYPTAARATGVGVASATGRIGAVLSSFTGVYSFQIGGPLGFFGIVATLCALCGLAGWAARASKAAPAKA